MTEAEATDATIQLMYQAYYAEMGGNGVAPDVRAQIERTGDRQCHRLQAAGAAKGQAEDRPSGRQAPLPVALIFACLVVVYVGFRYYWR